MSDQEPLLELEEQEEQEETEEPDKPEYRIVLLGKIGVGKNIIGNAILGNNRNAFESASLSEFQKETQEFGDKLLTLVVTPDLFENRVTEVDVRREIHQCICFASPGPHVFLVVFQTDSFTEEDQEIVRKIQQMFGEGAVRYSMVLFSCGDDPEAANVAIDEFISNNPPLGNFIRQCGGGYHVFNNRTRDPAQVRELLEKINILVQGNGGSCYTNKMFEKVESAIKKKMERLIKEENETPEEARNKAERNNESLQDSKVAFFIGSGLGLGVGVCAGIGIEAAVGAAAAGATIGLVGGPVGAVAGGTIGFVGAAVGAATGLLLGASAGAGVHFTAKAKMKKKACVLQ
uniref:AIG1-type G domain-containing protein n=1 Tax=Astatotilapia calliptera TaxID=8154 RepID=A0AAX7VL87_ASTCA